MTRPRRATLTRVSRIFTTSVASVYPHYVTKVEKKGRTKAELDQVIEWLTGFDESELREHLAAETTFEDFFADAQLNPHASSITGVVCGIRVENIDDPLMQKIRYLDKLVDELARGKADGEGPEGLTRGPHSVNGRRAKPHSRSQSGM